jgi:hypothetical protein
MANESEIRDLFKSRGVALTRDEVWTVQGSHVVKHKALERLAAALRIQFDMPQILRAERDEAVVLVRGTIGEISEWSIGEALVNANYRVTGKMAPYVYAMAEKRAKDRVIIKLAGLHGVYSEDEADDFKQQPQQQESPAAGAAAATLRFAQTEPELIDWLAKNKHQLESMREDERDFIRAAYKSHLATLRQKEAA